MAVLRSDEAAADLENIWLTSAREYGIGHAERVLEHFDELFSLLDQFPGIGQDYPGIRKGIVYFPVRLYPFLVFFKQVPEGILIVRILHDRMRVKDHL